MKRFITPLVLVTAATFAAAGGATTKAETLRGAGSSFVSPLVSTWVQPYEAATGVHVDYNPIGSGGGIQAITNRSVDFGASDAPLTRDQFVACNGCVQIPWALSSTSVAYNVPGAPQGLRITGQVLASIFLGKVTKWNAPAIKSLNPGVNLPDLTITPIFRSDGSGTTYNFTDYLSRVSPEWKSKVGTGTQVNFPTGVGGRGSSGVSAVLARTQGGLIYVDVAFSLKNRFHFFRVKNKAGVFQLPGTRAIAAAAATVRSDKQIPMDNKLSIVDPPASQKLAYPICTFTYVILPTKTAKAPQLRRFVFWALTGGQKYGPKLLFVNIPKPVLVRAERTLKRVQS